MTGEDPTEPPEPPFTIAPDDFWMNPDSTTEEEYEVTGVYQSDPDEFEVEYEWQAPEDDRVGGVEATIPREAFEPEQLPPTWSDVPEKNESEIPGEPVSFWECSHCGSEVSEFDEDRIEKEGKVYCSIDCLNEAIHG